MEFSRKTFYKWLLRYQNSAGEPGSLVDRSKRPKRSPQQTSAAIEKLILELRKTTGFGPARIALFLQKDHNLTLPGATIYAILKRNRRLGKPKTRKKIPKLYQLPNPGHLQLDIKILGDYRPKGFVQYSVIDDATRIKFTKLYQERSNFNSLDFLDYLRSRYPFPIKSIRTDNDSVFTNRFTGEPKTHPLLTPRIHPFSLACKHYRIRHKLNRRILPITKKFRLEILDSKTKKL